MREAAARLRMCTATIYRLITSGKLPAFRFAGSLLRIRGVDLAALVVECAT